MSAPYTQVQTKTNSTISNTATMTLTWTSNTTSGNTILLVFGSNNQAFAHVTSITDSNSNVYTAINTGTNTGSGELWYAKNINGGTTPTITINIGTATGNGVCAIAAEYTGLSQFPLDAKATSTGTSTTVNSASTVATSQASELVVVWGAIMASLTPTVGAGFGNLVSVNNASNVTVALQDKTVTTTAVQTGSITIASNIWIGGVAALRPKGNILVSNTRPHPFQPGLAR